MLDAKSRAKELKKTWDSDSRWKDVSRPYKAEDVVSLMGSVQIEYTLARRGSEKLWSLLNTEDFVPCLGALTGGQAVQQVKAGIKAFTYPVGGSRMEILLKRCILTSLFTR